MALGDAQRLPTYIRHWFIERTGKEIKAMNEAIEKASKRKGKK